MKKGLGLAVFSTVLLSLLVVGCGSETDVTPNDENGAGDTTTTPVGDLYQANEERQIVVADLPTLEVGDTIDLDEYISIVPGDNETYEERNDLSYEIEMVSSSAATAFSRVTNILTETNTFEAIASGYGYFNISSHQVSSMIAIRVASVTTATDPRITEIVEAFEGIEYSNYTVTKSYEINEAFETVEAEETATFYRTDNYCYSVDNQFGYVVSGDEVYQFDLVDEKDETTFYPYLYQNNSDSISLTTYNNYYRTFARIFSTVNISYNSTVAELYGEEYAYGIQTGNAYFTNLLNALGLNSTFSLYGYTMTLYFAAPVVENDQISFYIYARNTTYSLSVLMGPLTLTDVGNTSVDLLDDVAEQGIERTTLDMSLLAGLFTSYKSTAKGRYVNADGTEFDAPDYFKMYLPDDLDLTIEVTPDSLYFSDYSYVVKGESGDLTLKLDTEDGLYHEYDGDTDLGVYSHNGSSFSDYLDVDIFSYYSIDDLFTTSNFSNVYFYIGADGAYRATTALNSAAATLLQSFIPFTSSSLVARTDGPLYYYLSNSKVSITMGEYDSFSGKVVTAMIDSGETFYYEYTFDVYLTANE